MITLEWYDVVTILVLVGIIIYEVKQPQDCMADGIKAMIRFFLYGIFGLIWGSIFYW